MKPKFWRKSSKLTLKTLAKKAGVAAGYLSEVENGVKKPSGRVLTAYHRLSNGLVSPGDFKIKPRKKRRRLKRRVKRSP